MFCLHVQGKAWEDDQESADDISDADIFAIDIGGRNGKLLSIEGIPSKQSTRLLIWSAQRRVHRTCAAHTP